MHRLRHAALGALLAFAASIAPAAAQDNAPQVRIAQGAITGETRDGVEVFRGLPFAAPPVGPLRWQPPQPPAAWHGVRTAKTFGPACPQARVTEAAAGGEPAATSEDCLTLNIWAPARHDRPLPVMVWLHGGAHRQGAGSLPFYDGTAFARDGVILVTINYRLGLLGYFAHPALTAAAAPDAPLANYGTMDQIAALKWVRTNIAAFGGDPRNVTVFGESAGGASTLVLMTIPQAKGLFAKAIVESGGGWNAMTTLAQAEQSGVAAATAAGLGPNATLEQLRALPPETLKVQAGLGFGPVVDGRLVKQSAVRAFAGGQAADVPLMIGFNSDEGSLMEAFRIPSAQIIGTVPPEGLQLARSVYGARAGDDDALARRLFADGAFSGPARWVARQSAGGAPAYLYRFDYVPERLRERRSGVRHGGEIPYVFETWSAAPTLANFLTPADEAVAHMVHSCWVAFARTGRPSCEGAPDWPAYTPGKDALMNFGLTPEVRTGFDAQVYDLLEKALLPRALGQVGDR